MSHGQADGVLGRGGQVLVVLGQPPAAAEHERHRQIGFTGTAAHRPDRPGLSRHWIRRHCWKRAPSEGAATAVQERCSFAAGNVSRTMGEDQIDGRLCRCGHPRSAHMHYRRGTECTLCAGCPRYRPERGLAKLLAAMFRHPALPAFLGSVPKGTRVRLTLKR